MMLLNMFTVTVENKFILKMMLVGKGTVEGLDLPSIGQSQTLLKGRELQLVSIFSRRFKNTQSLYLSDFTH